MQITLKTTDRPEQLRSGCLVLGVPARSALTGTAAAVDKATGGLVTQLRERGDLETALGKTLMLPVPAGLKAERLLLISLGEQEQACSDADFRKLVQATLSALGDARVADAHWLLPELTVADRDPAWQLQQLATLCVQKSYSYTATVSKPKPAFSLRKLSIDAGAASASALRAAIQRGVAIGNGINAARRLGDLPPNICTPSLLAKEARSLARAGARSGTAKAGTKGRAGSKLKVSVLDEKAMKELGMGALLAVAAGTAEPARLIVMEYSGGKRGQQPQVLVGKGITFDSGGISIKPGPKMDEMKFDMCGAASVIGTMTTVLELQLPINVVGIIAATENLPSGTATKPGDVVTSMSGQTIEILNTDAEGRLVLCDALTYASRFKPAAVIDIATLTGACVVALGKHASGLYSNQDDFAQELLEAGQRAGDRAWQMPLWDDYQKQLDSNFADMANIGGPSGGSITAACFLARFTRDYRWAHLDIAGTAWDEGA
ncbi:MAG: leucyl aminopeptidase, partial [Spongiibacteraceae bacterium]|nr:leucyl aminopeptidase [Spongiibacteraceae bacterium]